MPEFDIDIADSWAMAERAAFDHLLATTSSAEGTRAFLGAVPEGAFDVWMFSTGGGAASMLWQAHPTDLLIDARVEGVFRERTGAQALTMLIAGALPLREVANIQCFRFAEDGFPEPVPDLVAMANDARAVRRVWRVSIGFELAFRLRKTHTEPDD